MLSNKVVKSQWQQESDRSDSPVIIAENNHGIYQFIVKEY